MNPQISRLSPEEFRSRLPEALGVYVAAMGYSPEVIRSRASAWVEHSHRPGWSCVAAFGPPLRHRLFASPRPSLLGICYGYRAAPGQWWFEQVAAGLRRPPSVEPVTLPPDYVELTELHVAPGAQGAGIGRALLRAFLADRPEPRVLLSTPEVVNEDSPAWRLYRSEGFEDVLRRFLFDGDRRPFAVLRRELPAR